MTNGGDRQRNRTLTRRTALHGLGAAITASIAGCNDAETTPEPTPAVTSSPTPEPLAQSDIQKEALEHAREHYKMDRSGKVREGIRGFHEQVEKFLDNNGISEGFKDTQLEYWLDAPSSYDDPVVDVVENEEVDWELVAEDWKYQILDQKLLQDDDWLKTGQPHILPDGSEGEGHHYNLEKEPNWDPDAFMPRWYNEKGNVFDIEASSDSKSDWEYIGPKPDQGDRVGKLGETPEHKRLDESFSIAKYLDGTSKEDLVGQPVTVCKVDWSAEGSHNYSPEPSEETLDIAEDILKDIGIQSHFIKGKEIGYNEVQEAQDLEPAWKQNMPTELKGPVEYGVMVHGPGGGRYYRTSVPAGLVASREATEKQTATTLLHECYGHPILGGGHASEETETIMTPSTDPDPIMQFTDEEEEILRKGIDIRSPVRLAQGEPGFYTGIEPTYLPDDYFEGVAKLY